jgi:hypothetical protein
MLERMCALVVVALMALPAQGASGGTLGFSSSSYSVVQNAGSVTFTVKRSGGTSGKAAVHYQTSNGSAVAGQQYTAIGGTLNWASGDASAKSFTVYIRRTASFTGTKTFNLALSYPRGASLGTPVKAVVSIQGKGSTSSAGTVSLNASSYSVAQNGGTIAVSVRRANGSSGTASVKYATANGTAVAGTHYTSKSGTLSWANGDTASKTISIPVSNSTPFTGTKNFTIALSGASGASMARRSSSRPPCSTPASCADHRSLLSGSRSTAAARRAPQVRSACLHRAIQSRRRRVQ